MARGPASGIPGSGDGRARSGDHPGARFGAAADGPGAAAGFLRRLAGVAVDWLLAILLAPVVAPLLDIADTRIGVPDVPWLAPLVWFVLTVVPTAVFGATVGMVVVGLRAATVQGAAIVGVPRAVVRTLLLGLVVPALIRDEDGRGWHDLAASTLVVRTR